MDEYENIIAQPSEGAKKEALKHPNGYVYVIEEAYKGDVDVPPEAILGAWKVNEKGVIVGIFLPNPNYKGKLH